MGQSFVPFASSVGLYTRQLLSAHSVKISKNYKEPCKKVKFTSSGTVFGEFATPSANANLRPFMRITPVHPGRGLWPNGCTFFDIQGKSRTRRIAFMSDYQESNPTIVAGTPRWVGLAVAVLGALSLLGLGVGWSAINHANSVEQSTQAALKQQNDALGQRVAKAEDTNQQLQSDLKVVTGKLNVTQSELISARKQNKAAVVNYTKKLDELGTNVNAQLATKASSDDVSKLGGDVTGV